MKRKTSRTPRRRPPTRPVRPPVIPKPPAPTIAQERERRRRRPPPPPPSPAEQIMEAVQAVTTPAAHEDWRLRQIEPGYSTHEAWRLGQAEARPGATPWSALMATVRGSVLGSTVRGLGESFGPVPEPVRGWLAAMETPMRGRGGVPYRAQPEQPFTNIYAGQKPAEPWFMREGLGGRAGRAGEIMQAWAGGGRPLFVPKTVTSLLGVSEEQMKEMGYERTLGGSWRAAFPERPVIQPPPSYGGSYGYTPSRYGYGRGGGGVRGQAAVRGMGLINWRIGL